MVCIGGIAKWPQRGLMFRHKEDANDDNKLWLHDHQGTLNGMPCTINATITKDDCMKIAGTAIIKATEATGMPALDTLAELSFTWKDKVQRPKVAISSWEYNHQSNMFKVEFTSDPSGIT